MVPSASTSVSSLLLDEDESELDMSHSKGKNGGFSLSIIFSGLGDLGAPTMVAGALVTVSGCTVLFLFFWDKGCLKPLVFVATMGGVTVFSGSMDPLFGIAGAVFPFFWRRTLSPPTTVLKKDRCVLLRASGGILFALEVELCGLVDLTLALGVIGAAGLVVVRIPPGPTIEGDGVMMEH